MDEKLELGNRTLEDLPPHMRYLGLEEGFRELARMNRERKNLPVKGGEVPSLPPKA